jgi:hypothetical protein
MLTLWFALGFIAAPETGEPPTTSESGGGFRMLPLYLPPLDYELQKNRNREEVEALLLTSAI